MPSGEPVVIVDHLHKVYGDVVAVDDVSFDVWDGEIFGIIGPNGAGKTTTVESIQGLRHPDSGTIRVLGLNPQSQSQALRQRIGAQLQQSSLPDRITVSEALHLFASFAVNPVPPEQLIEQWGLVERRDAAFGDLSGGQKQRLFIALAFVNDPQVVFLDELTQGLDPQARLVTWDLIREIRARGTTVVLVTHFMDEAETLCDRVAIIDRGRVVGLDTPIGLVDALKMPTCVRFTTTRDDLPDLTTIAGVRSVVRDGDRVAVEGSGPVLALVASTLVAQDILPTDLRADRPTLEDAFIALTGRSIRE